MAIARRRRRGIEMTHMRKQIRDAIVTALTGLPTTGTHIFKSRVYPNEQQKLPLLCVYALKEDSEIITMGTPYKYQRDLEVMIEGYAKAIGVNTLDDVLDLISLEVEEALAVDITLGGLAKNTLLDSTEIDMVGDGEVPVGVIRLTFLVRYVTTNDDVENPG